MNQEEQILLGKFSNYLKAQGFSTRTIPDYHRYTKHFLNYLEEIGQNEISEVSMAIISDYQIRLLEYRHRGKPLTNRSRAIRLVAIKAFFKFLIKSELINHDPTAGIELPKCPKTLPRNILTKKEIARLLAIPKLDNPLGIRDRAILETFYSTGIRASELCQLRLTDIDLVRGELRVNKGKNSKDRIIPLGEIAIEYLSNYLKTARPQLVTKLKEPTLFLTKRGKKFIYTNMSYLVANYAKKAGIKKPISCHSLRHTCATHLLKGKADIRHIQKILGHTSLNTTQKYTKVEITDLKKVHRRCHPREQREVIVNEGWY